MIIKSKSLLVVCSLLFLCSSTAQVARMKYSAKGISFTIDRHPGWSDDIKEGSSINIRCVFRNETKNSIHLFLADHNDYSGTEQYPAWLQARVTDVKGQIMTRNKMYGDWYSASVNNSDSIREMPGDRITLKPGEKVTRIVPLAAVIEGLSTLPNDIRAGEYTVQLRLNDIVSNELKIKVIPKE
jgi:hypothetical protein